MRIVVDTNVFVSGIFWKGTPSLVIDAWLNDQVYLAVNTQIIDEYNRVLSELGAKRPGTDVSRVMNIFPAKMELCTDTVLPNPVCEDPDDDKFIACAIEAHSKIIVSGDKKLLAVSDYHGIEILKPAAFVHLYL